jgi:hypothetical protein
MPDVKSPKLPKMNQEDFKSCANCIHFGKDTNHESGIVCGAYRAIVQVAKELAEKYPFIEVAQVIQDPADSCENFIPKIGMISNKDLV